MNQLSKEIDASIKRCQTTIKSAETRLRNVTKNTLIIARRKGTTQFWQRVGKTKKREYVKAKNTTVLGPLSNKTYSERVLIKAQKMLNVLQKAREILQKGGALESELEYEKLWDSWPDELKPLTKMHAQTFKHRADVWENESYEKLNMPILDAHKTLKGEYVRSKSELIIADTLFANYIPYHYEERLQLGNKTVYPDFTILNPRTGNVMYIEHLGMLDDDKYKEDAIEKILTYMENGHWIGRDLFLTYESKSRPFHNEQIDEIIKNYLSVN